MAQITDYSVTLQGWMSPVQYQGDQGSCGPCMIVNAVGMISNMYGDHFSVNPQVLYNMSLQSEGWLGADIGVIPTKFMNLLTTNGVTENTTLNYGLDQIGVLPSNIDYLDAATHKVMNYTKLTLQTQETTLSHMIADQLLQGKATLMAFNATNNFMYEWGPLSTQNGDNTGAVAGGHFVQIVGVDTASNMLTVASWGTAYGDHGLFHISLDSFYDDKGGNKFNIDNIFVLNGFDGKDLTQNATTKLVASAYVGILDRAADAGGMTWWAHDVATTGKTLASLCDNMLLSTEYTSTHVGETNTQFLTNLYHNVLNRDIDAGGLQYWLNGLTINSKGTIAASIITEVVQEGHWAYDTWFDSTYTLPASGDPNMYAESLLFNNKLIAAQDYAITLQADSNHTALAHQIIDNVTTDSGSIWGVALVGVNDALGRGHIAGITTT